MAEQQTEQHAGSQQQQEKNQRQLDPITPDNFLKSSQDFLADAYTGRDVTRPRDLYAFLSVGHLPDPRRALLQSRSVNTDYKRVTFDFRDSVSRRKSYGFEEPSARYLQFDLRKSPLIPLPSIKNSTFPLEELRENAAVEQIVAEELAKEIKNEIPISLVKGYHKVNISTTYIFAPNERIPEAVKYSPKVVLPKIPSKPPGTADIPPPSVLTIDSQNNVEALHKKKFEVVNISQRSKNIPPGTHIFGVRPECLFINTQLGDKNPLLRDPNKATMTSNVPKAVPGLQDLKDYDCYPEVYWRVRAETIAQPHDLEADMIDRDLYRLRQISTLKLNSIERTCPLRQDPFRRWRGKAGEPLFSPKQQKPPQRKQRVEKTKATEISEAISNNNPVKSKVMLEVTVTPLRLTDSNMQADLKGPDSLLSSRSNPGNFNDSPQVKTIGHDKPDNANVDCPDLPTFDTPHDAQEEITPREAVEASLNTFRKLQEQRDSEENLNFGKVTAQKLYQMKNNKESRKQEMKTALIKVDLEPVDAYNKQQRGAQRRQLTDRTYNSHQSVLDSHRKGDNTERTTDRDASPSAAQDDSTSRDLPQVLEEGGRQPAVAPVASLLFKPPSNYKVPGSYPDALGSSIYGNTSMCGNTSTYIGRDELGDTFLHSTFAYPSPEVPRTESGGTARAERKNSGAPMKPVKLEVFSERRQHLQGPIKIPTGRTTYHPDMPAYKLDLKNYPPMNARQMCRRSNSAGIPDSRQTHLTAATLESLREMPSGQAQAHTGVASGMETEATLQPPRTADVDIRFGSKGEVIVSSRDMKRAANGRRSR